MTGQQISTVCLTWWTGDLVADLIWTPAILVWLRPSHTQAIRRPTEAVAASLFVPLTFVPAAIASFYRSAFLMLALLWAALRFGQRDGNKVRIRVTATGIGISEMRMLARQMNGELTIASKQGKGTTELVALPAA